MANCIVQIMFTLHRLGSRIPTPYFCIGQESESESESEFGNVIESLLFSSTRDVDHQNVLILAPERNLPVDWTISPWEERELLREE